MTPPIGQAQLITGRVKLYLHLNIDFLQIDIPLPLRS